jgi:hypothetical protein
MKIGDKVAILDDDIEGVIIAIHSNKICIQTDDGFEMDFSPTELVLMDTSISKTDFIPDDIQVVLSEKEVKKKKKNTRIKPKDRSRPPMVVDLHIHQLIPKTKGLTNSDMLTIQIETAKRQLDFAIKKRIQRIVFIHGVGEGVLRAELEYLFRQYGNLDYNDADFQKYGRGATEVYVFQNKKPSP